MARAEGTDAGAVPDPGAHAAVMLRFEGAAPMAWTGEDRIDARFNFFLGADAARWRTDVPAYRAASAPAIYPGIDLRVYVLDGHFEYDLILAPGARLDDVVVSCAGVERIVPRRDGGLELHTPLGSLVQTAPRTWQVADDGVHVAVACRLERRDDHRFGFIADEYDASRPLIVDPGVLWSTLLGGRSDDSAHGVGIDAATGHVTMGGSTLSVNFPVTAGAFDSSYNGHVTQPRSVGDAFVAQFDGATGALRWATFVGGSGNDDGSELGVDGTGHAVLTGWTSSTDFPTTPAAFDRTFNGLGQGGLYGGGDVFVARVAPTGNALVYATYIGGDDLEYAVSLAVHPDGSATVGGHVHSTDFPTTPGAYDRTFGGFSDAFVTCLDPTGSTLRFSTFFGGTLGEEYVYAMALGVDGSTTFAGGTDSMDLPVTPGALQTSMNGGAQHLADGYVARLSADGSTLRLCSYLGTPGDDVVWGACVEPTGETTLTGDTNSPAFLTTSGAYRRNSSGLLDVFALRLDPTGNRILWCTLVGGGGNERGEAIVSDGSGGVVITGSTMSPDFPTTAGAADRTHNGSNDAVLLRFDHLGTRLTYSTFSGGSSWDTGLALTADVAGTFAMVGVSYSSDYPTTAGAAQRFLAGGGDASAQRHDLLPTGAARFGAASPGCSGAPVIRADGEPQVGHAAFGVGCGRAPSGGVGVLAVAARRLVTPIQVLGADLWVDPQSALVLLPANAHAWRGSEVALPIPPIQGLAGSSLFLQFLWVDACATGGLSGSSGLAITIAP